MSDLFQRGRNTIINVYIFSSSRRTKLSETEISAPMYLRGSRAAMQFPSLGVSLARIVMTAGAANQSRWA